MKYLLDENLAGLYRVQLKRQVPELTVWMIGDPGAPERGTKDPDILDWCSQYEFVLVTNNRASMPSHLADHLASGKYSRDASHLLWHFALGIRGVAFRGVASKVRKAILPGILVFRRRATIKAILEDLILIAKVAESSEFRDQITHIPLK